MPQRNPELVTLLSDLLRMERVFDRYRLEEQIGEGGFGAVFRAYDEVQQESVALKFVFRSISDDRQAIDDLRREVRRSLRLSHHSIVRIHQLLHDPNTKLAAISMEYLPGRTLRDLKCDQSDSCFDVSSISSWVEQLCDALVYAHELTKTVHRDIKPHNLMILSDGLLKVMDFGIARSIAESLSHTTQVVPNSAGTIAYMSPQQLRGEQPKVADDIYALGSTLYELITGRPPFFRGDFAAITYQILHEPPKAIAERRAELGLTHRSPVPPTWEKAIISCLQKEPEHRPASVRELKRLLGESSTEVLAVSSPATAQPSQPNPLRANPEKLFSKRFLLDRIVARGSFTELWAAHDERLDVPVGLRMLPEHLARDLACIAELRERAQLNAPLTHPNIVQTYNFCQDGQSGRAAIVVERIEGETLSEILRAAPCRCLEVEAIQPWIGGLCDALDYLHIHAGNARQVHSSIRPSKIMLTAEGRPVLLDSGIARSLIREVDHLEPSHAGGGALLYMSPQQFMGEPPTPADDLYSLGATLYHLLTGKPPYFRGSSHAILALALQSAPAPIAARREELGCTGLPPVPTHWEATIFALLEKDPAKRPRTAGEVIDRLLRSPSIRPSEARPLPPEDLPGRHPKVNEHPVIARLNEKVWVTQDPATGEKHVVKERPRSTDRGFHLEIDTQVWIRTIRDWDHPCIAVPRGFGTLDSNPASNTSRFDFYVREFVPGLTLSQWLAARSYQHPTAVEVMPWLNDLASALTMLHQRTGCGHGKLSPDHLIIRPDNRLVVLFDGLIDPFEEVCALSLPDDGVRNRDSTFLAPEERIVCVCSVESDIYSVGKILRWLLVLGADASKDFLSAPPLPESWQTAIARCLEPASTLRPRTINELLQALNP